VRCRSSTSGRLASLKNIFAIVEEGPQPLPLLAKDWLKRPRPDFARVVPISHRALAQFPSSRLYLLVTPLRSERLRLPVHDFMALSPVDPLRKINNLASVQFTTLFHGYTSMVRCRSGAGRVSRRVALGRRRAMPPAPFPRWPVEQQKIDASTNAPFIRMIRRPHFADSWCRWRWPEHRSCLGGKRGLTPDRNIRRSSLRFADRQSVRNRLDCV
jgi:hypothetical protein